MFVYEVAGLSQIASNIEDLSFFRNVFVLTFRWGKDSSVFKIKITKLWRSRVAAKVWSVLVAGIFLLFQKTRAFWKAKGSDNYILNEILGRCLIAGSKNYHWRVAPMFINSWVDSHETEKRNLETKVSRSKKLPIYNSNQSYNSTFLFDFSR